MGSQRPHRALRELPDRAQALDGERQEGNPRPYRPRTRSRARRRRGQSPARARGRRAGRLLRRLPRHPARLEALAQRSEAGAELLRRVVRRTAARPGAQQHTTGRQTRQAAKGIGERSKPFDSAQGKQSGTWEEEQEAEETLDAHDDLLAGDRARATLLSSRALACSGGEGSAFRRGLTNEWQR